VVSTQGTGCHRRATFRVRGALRCQLNIREVQTCCRDLVFRASSLTSAIVGWVAVDWHTRSCLPPRDALTRFTHSTHKRIDPPSVEVEGPDIPEAPWCLNAATPNKWKVLVLNTISQSLSSGHPKDRAAKWDWLESHLQCTPVLERSQTRCICNAGRGDKDTIAVSTALIDLPWTVADHLIPAVARRHAHGHAWPQILRYAGNRAR
jgi:hypothetical protein